jgi:hypothetical protein
MPVTVSKELIRFQACNPVCVYGSVKEGCHRQFFWG